MKLRQQRAVVCVGSLCLIAAVFAGCGSSTAKARIVNASPGEGAITATIGGTSVASSLDYGTGSSYATVSSGSSVSLNVEQSSTSNSVLDQTISLTSKDTYTILVANYSTALAAVTLTDNNSSPSSGDVNIRIVQASPGLATADVYIVTPGTSLSNASADVTSLSFESASVYVPKAAGTYEIYFTPTGQKTAYIDSGAISFSSGQVRTVVGLNGSNGGYTTAVLDDLN
jgi:Domain of unknown function (DUF4397)